MSHTPARPTRRKKVAQTLAHLRAAEESGGLTHRMAMLLMDPTFWDEVYEEWDKAGAIRRMQADEHNYRERQVDVSRMFWSKQDSKTREKRLVDGTVSEYGSRLANETTVSDIHLARMRRTLRRDIA